MTIRPHHLEIATTGNDPTTDIRRRERRHQKRTLAANHSSPLRRTPQLKPFQG